MRTLILIAAALALPGCALFDTSGPSNAGTNTMTMYQAEVVRDSAGNVVRGEGGEPLVEMTNPREITERGFVLHLQQKAIDQCSQNLRASMQGEKQAFEDTDSASGEESYWEWKQQRDLIAALDEDFDPTGCRTLVTAQQDYWQTIIAELRLVQQRDANRSRWLVAALQLTGFYLITDSVGDTLVGIAEASGGVNIGNRIAGDISGGGGGSGGAGTGPKGAGAPGGGSSVDGNLAGDTTIERLTTGSDSPLQTGDGQVLSGSDAQLQEGDGTQGQAISRPTTQPNISTEGGSLNNNSEGVSAEGSL